MRRPKRLTIAGATSVAAIISLLATNFVVAQSPGTPSSSSVESFIQVASGASAYAQGLISAAGSRGLDVSSEDALLASGNASLAAASATLNPGGDLTAGLEDAHAAMSNFTAAAAAASAAIESVGLTSPIDVGADAATVAELNQSASSLSSAIDHACAETGVNSTVLSQFSQDCVSAKGSITSATAAIGDAEAMLMTQSSVNATAFAALVSQARSALSSAETEFGSLIAFTYPSRVQAYVDGPIAAQYAAANASVALQTRLVGWFDADQSGYQAFQSSQSSVAGGIAASASSFAGDSTSASSQMGALTSSIDSQEPNAARLSSDLTSFSQQVAGLPLLGSILSLLLGDASAAQGSLTAYDSSMSALAASSSSFSSTTPGSLPSFVTTFDGDGSSEGTAASSFSFSFSALQGELSTVAKEFPLITALGTWVTTFAGDATTVNAGEGDVASALSGADSSLQATSSGAASLTTLVQGAAQVDVSSALQQNLTSVSSSEAGLLNATAQTSLSAVTTSLSSEAQLASAFAASSRALTSTAMSALSAASQSLASQASSLSSQGQATSGSMSRASTYLTSDLSARTSAIASAQSLVAQALDALDSGEVPTGASLLTQASGQFTLASAQAQ